MWLLLTTRLIQQFLIEIFINVVMCVSTLLILIAILMITILITATHAPLWLWWSHQDTICTASGMAHHDVDNDGCDFSAKFQDCLSYFQKATIFDKGKTLSVVTESPMYDESPHHWYFHLSTSTALSNLWWLVIFWPWTFLDGYFFMKPRGCQAKE
jgi:hypothetical protein